MLQLHKHSQAAEFLAAAEHALAQEEAINNVIYGIARALAAHPERIVNAPYLATVQDGGALVCAAMMTPPWRLLLYAADVHLAWGSEPAARLAPALDLVLDDLRANGWAVSGVTARAPLAEQFAALWARRTGERTTVDVRMRVFELREVQWPPLPPGAFRQATSADLPLVHQWYCDFGREAVHNDPLPTIEGVQRSIEDQNVYLWDDGGPVSLAARGRRLPHGASVGPVYTPPELRGRGYASAVVAALSAMILANGADFCTLFTDLANPTSNKIYQRIGYQPRCDFTEYSFRAVVQ
jgi:predicted GNAT family acetyltransferase